MKEKSYHFKASFPDVDFRRILNENPNADFIVVRWTPKNASYQCGLALVSKRGADRMAAAGIARPPKYWKVGLNKNGTDWSSGPVGDPIHVIGNICYCRQVISKIKKHEKQRHQIRVTAIR